MRFDTPFGAWRGPVQFRTSVEGQRDPASHQVVSAVIEVAADGQVRGTVQDTGGRILGLGRQFVSPKQVSLDVTFKECTDARRNQRYTGYLMVNTSTKTADLTLSQSDLQTATQISGQFRR